MATIPTIPGQGDTPWYVYAAALDQAVRDLQNTPSGGGADGRGITSITRTSGDGSAGTTDTYTITYTDSTTSTFTVTNGADGAQGIQGIQGPKGDTGATGAPGTAGYVYIADTATQADKDALLADPANEGKMYIEYTP